VTRVRLLHAADCHLGSGPSRREEAAFELLVDMAEAERVDAVLIAGDLFDTNRVEDETVAWAGEQVARLRCDVVILPGNHDALVSDSVYGRFDADAFGATVLNDPDGRTVELDHAPVTVWGRPVVEHEESSRPLACVPPRPDTGYGVLMAHGLVVDGYGAGGRGSPILPCDLDGLEWDYVALGHWGRFLEVRYDPPVVYAGPIASKGTVLPGAVLVEFFTDGPPRWQWRRLDD
jgi:DNA repair exonuclease SbcCD nuclease subunit